ncbi:MAG TPA: hypothetical protein VH325_14040 [Bryobacteraceae bacterium]|jgi:uncharacterized membrane protein HdeD (DUF308 family)|nr:hypothetical protein [Bryobacteraceae bacterium]
MIQTLMKNWWLLALVGILDLIYSAVNVFMQDANGSLTFRTRVLKSTMLFLGEVALAAGVCTIVAGLWRSTQGKSWLLVLNGLALTALGLTLNGIFGFRISLRTIALMIILMAISIGSFNFVIARTLRHSHHVADGWFFSIAGAGSLAFALPFLALAFHWIKLGPGSHQDLLWFGSYFAFTAICMLAIAFRLHGLDRSQPAQWEALAPLKP